MIKSTPQTTPLYECSSLIVSMNTDMEAALTYTDFQIAQSRKDALVDLINCGIEYTTIAQLDKIAKTDT